MLLDCTWVRAPCLIQESNDGSEKSRVSLVRSKDGTGTGGLRARAVSLQRKKLVDSLTFHCHDGVAQKGSSTRLLPLVEVLTNLTACTSLHLQKLLCQYAVHEIARSLPPGRHGRGTNTSSLHPRRQCAVVSIQQSFQYKSPASRQIGCSQRYVRRLSCDCS